MQDSRLTGGEWPLSRRGRCTCLALGLAAFALANAAPSFAAEAGITDGGTTLSYLGVAGEANDVTVGLSGTDFLITDTGAAGITNTGGCTVSAGPPAQATCPTTGITLIRVDLGDGTDALTINDSTDALVLARDGLQDTINCTGAGRVGADAVDQVNGCQSDLPPQTVLSGDPPGRTNQNPPVGFTSPDTDVTGFECRFDSGPFGSCGAPIPDGPHVFEARAVDGFGPDPTPVSVSVTMDTTGPETVIDSGPPDASSSRANFSFYSPDSEAVAFECSLDGEAWHTCASPLEYRGLGDGAHVFKVRAVDDLGNADATEATVSFTVSRSPVGAFGTPPGLIIVRPPASFVLIGGSTIKVSRSRIAIVRLNCSGNRDCAGELALTTAKRIRISGKRRRFVRLGAASFFIPAPRTASVKIPLTKRAFRIIRKRKRLKITVTVTDRDRVGRTRISTREVFLRP